MTEDNGGVAMQPETKLDSCGSMLTKIFMEPSKVFERVKQKPLWVSPFVILLVVVTLMALVTAPLQFEAQKQAIMDSDSYTPQEKEQIVSQMEQYAQLAYLGAVAAPIMMAIFFFLAIGLLMLMANVFLGGDASFKQVLSMYAWAGLITALGMVVKAVIILVKNSADVRTSLAILLPAGEMKTWSFVILNTFTDVFTIWAAIVTIIGVSIVYGFSKGKAAVAVLVPTVILLGLGAVAGKMFG